MISYLKGRVIEASFNRFIIDVGGVGYGVSLSVQTAAQLSKGNDVELFISEVVREQAYDLYGFLSLKEQTLFEQLNKVSGVGPRLALSILGLGDSNDIASAVGRSDDKYFSRAPGVGKKLAERLVIELRDKVDSVILSSADSASEHGSLDAKSALMSLGFSSEDARKMLDGVDNSLSIEQQVTAALKNK